MPIDILTERIISMCEASHMLPGRPSLCTLWRWRTKGAHGRRLESLVLGGKVFTSAEAVQRFVEQRGNTDVPVVRTPLQLERAIDRAERVLNREGIQ